MPWQIIREVTGLLGIAGGTIAAFRHDWGLCTAMFTLAAFADLLAIRRALDRIATQIENR